MHHSYNYYIKYYCLHAITFNVLLLLPFSSCYSPICLFISFCFCCGGAEIKNTYTDTDMLVVQCKILQIVNIPSKATQCKTIDLISAHKLLQIAAENIAQLRRSFDAVLNEASTIASTWGLPRQF